MSRNLALTLFLLPAALLVGCPDDTGTGGGGTGGTGGGTGGGPAVDACADAEALRGTCQALPDRFDASTTLEKGCYQADISPVLAADVTLTISPGVTIIFGDGAGLDVSEGRALVAAGTAAEPICLTGATATRGAWDGVKLGRTEGPDDRLDFVTIEFAGSTKSDAEAAAIKVVSDSRVVTLSLTNTTVRESEGYGLYLVGSAEATAFSGNTFTANTLGPASVDSQVAGLLDAASSYSGNDVDEVTVRSDLLSKNLTWAALDVPYHLTGHMDVEAPWVLEAPNTVVMSADGWISVNGDDAALTAVGTAEAPILFTGAETQRGFWTALRFDTTSNAANRLEHVTVEYGGSTKSDFNGAGIKADADSQGTTLSLSNTTVRECEGFGLYLTGSAVTPTFASNTFTANGLGPASVGSQAVHQLETSSSYTGNDVDHLRVRDGNVGQAVTWLDLGVPYELEENIHVALVWTLAPGVTLLMPKDSWISVAGDAAGFHAVGTAQSPVTISGIEKTSGYWHSIVFDSSLNAANVFDHATIEYGGSAAGGGELGMIQAQSDSHGVSVSVTNSIVRNSGQYGVWLGGAAQYNADIETSNTFSGNASGDVFKQ